MKSFLVLMFGLMAIAFISATSLNERVSFRPSTTVQMQKFNSKVLVLPSPGNQNKKIQRIIHLIHLMELACLEKYAKPVYSRNRFAYRRPFKTTKPLRMPASQNDGSNKNHQMSSFYTGKQNQITLDNKRYFGNSRVIFVPPLIKITEKHVNFTDNSNEPNAKETPRTNYRKVSSDQVIKEKNNPNKESFLQNQNNFKILEISRPNSRKVKGQEPKGKTKGIENMNYNSEDTKFIKLLPQDVVSRKTEEKFMPEHSKVFEETPEISKTNVSRIAKPLKLPEQFPFHEIQSTTASNSSRHFLNQTKPKHIQQYEVQEIIEETVSIDLKNNEGDHFQNLPFDEKTIRGGLVSQNNETGIKDFINNSINSVLKSLIEPEVEITPPTENSKKALKNEKFNTWSFQSSTSASLSPRLFRTFSNQKSENILKISNENKSLYNREKQAKSVNITPNDDGKSDDRRKKTTEMHTKITPELQYEVNESRFTFVPTLAVEYHTTDVTLTTEKYYKYTTQSVLKTEKNIQDKDVNQNLQQKTSAVPETETSLGLFEQTSTLIHSSDKLANQFNNHTQSFFFVSQEIEKNFSQPMLQKTTENDAFEIHTTESQISYGEELVTDNSTTTDIPEFTETHKQETSTTLTAKNTVNTVKSFLDTTLNEMEVTTPDFQKPTNISNSFDLLTTAKSNLKKDKEAAGRKINFGQEPRKTTAFHQISNLESEEQRRSDILINENFNDYDDIDNNLSISNYLDRMKQGSSLLPTDLLNTTTDSIIPLIPVVINDLREGKISAEDMSILSKVFNKHWTTVVALANSTNLDMLPLFKMKNEEDLKNVLQNFYSENLEVTTTRTTVTRKNDNYEPYDYLEEYKDLYEDILESEAEENEKKRKKLRHKRNKEAESQRMEAIREHLNDIEEEENQENNYIYENILYGEMSEDEDANVLELRLKMADFNINLNNLTSRTKK